MISLEVSATGTGADELRRVMSRITNYRPLLEDMGKRLVTAFQRHIDTSTSPKGKEYPPLSRPRAKGHNPDPKPLIDTRALYEDLRYEITGSDELKAGSTLEYAVYQNKGTRFIPARTFIGADQSTQEALNGDMLAFLENALKT